MVHQVFKNNYKTSKWCIEGKHEWSWEAQNFVPYGCKQGKVDG
jgi:hypothetical protein